MATIKIQCADEVAEAMCIRISDFLSEEGVEVSSGDSQTERVISDPDCGSIEEASVTITLSADEEDD